MKIIYSVLITSLLVAQTRISPAATRYVDLNSSNATPPFVSWATAATNIQSAVNIAQMGDLILVNDGVYQVGTLNNQGPYGLEANRVYVNRAVTVRSVNGPEATLIVGSTNASGRIRCVALINGASISGFTLTNGAAQYGAGGVESASVSGVVSNCVIVGNLDGGAKSGTLYGCVIQGNRSTLGSFGVGAYQSCLSGCLIVSNYSSYRGGGAGGSYLTNCVVMGNYAGSFGGGIDNCTAVNCTIVGNTAHEAGGGVSGGYLTNCIVYYNSIEYAGPSQNTNQFSTSRIQNSCTTDIPASAINCFSTQPQFLNLATVSLRLQSNSPCIDTGFNLIGLPGTDFDGRPRIVNTTIDVGAYEFQGAETENYVAWLASYGLSSNASTDGTDTDGDGATNWHEWRADTIPTNALSVFRMVSMPIPLSGAYILAWQAVPTRHYWVERSTNSVSASDFQILTTNISGVAGNRLYGDLTATNGGPYFYRVGVQ